MKVSRRTGLSVTAAGLIHVATNPLSVLGQKPESPEWLIRQAAQRGHTDLGWSSR